MKNIWFFFIWKFSFFFFGGKIFSIFEKACVRNDSFRCPSSIGRTNRQNNCRDSTNLIICASAKHFLENCTCTLQRPRAALASTQCHQSLCRTLCEYPRIKIVFKRTAKSVQTARKRSITKTCLYNFDPLKPHFYIVKLGFTGYTLFFLFLLKT